MFNLEKGSKLGDKITNPSSDNTRNPIPKTTIFPMSDGRLLIIYNDQSTDRLDVSNDQSQLPPATQSP